MADSQHQPGRRSLGLELVEHVLTPTRTDLEHQVVPLHVVVVAHRQLDGEPVTRSAIPTRIGAHAIPMPGLRYTTGSGNR